MRDEPGARSGTGVEKLRPETTTCVRISELLFVAVHRVCGEHEMQPATVTAMRGRRISADT